MERYHFWLAAFDTRFFGCQLDCSRVIHCRVDAQELRIEPGPLGLYDGSANWRAEGQADGRANEPCESQVELDGRLSLPLQAIHAVTLEPPPARRGPGEPCAVRLELDRDVWRPDGIISHSLYLAALDPLDEQLRADHAETAALQVVLASLAAGRRPYHLDPNPYHRAFARLGWPSLARRKRWDPAASPRAMARHPLVQLAQAQVRFRQFNAFFWPAAVFLAGLAWLLARSGQAAGLFAITLLLAGMTLTWLLLSWQARDWPGRGGDQE